MKRIFLIGYMGVGKSTIGKELATRLNLSLIDLDHFIEARYLKSIRKIFEDQGEENFRKIESRLLHEVALFEDVIISTGGGTPCFFDNIAQMNEKGTTVYLSSSPASLAKKLERFVHSRPVLAGRSGNDLLAFIKESLEARKPFYTQAQITFDVDAMKTRYDIQPLVDIIREKTEH
jgi:shikimate kinase